MYKHYIFEVWPYGANVKIMATSSNIDSKFASNRSDYTTSIRTASIITFSYTEYNGCQVIGIDTNLNYNLNTTNKTFTISNEGKTNLIPYIRIICNNVKIPISFIDSDGTGNKWYTATVNSDNITLNGKKQGDYVKVAKNYIINWNKTSEQQIQIQKRVTTGSEYYACEANFHYLDNNNQEQEGSIRLWSAQETVNGKVIIPRLDGVSSTLIGYGKGGETTTLTRRFYKYFSLGIQVKILDGYSIYHSNTLNYIKNTNKTYDNTGFLTDISGKYYLYNERGIPTLLQNDILGYQWNSKFFYTTSRNESGESRTYYISPATSEIFYEWDFCDCECDCNCNCNCECNCHCNCDCNCDYVCHGWCECHYCHCECDCECNICNCQCNCECDGTCQCQCESGSCNCTCEACDCQCQCQCECECESGSTIYVTAGTYDKCKYTGQAYNNGWEHDGGIIGYVPAGTYNHVITTDQGWVIFEYNGSYWN